MRKAIAGTVLAIGAFAIASSSAVEDSIGDLIGTPTSHVAAHEDTLIDIAERYRVGFIELRAANPGVETWLPGSGTELVIPTVHILPAGPRRGIVINLADLRLYHFAPEGQPVSYPIGIGREAWETPLGLTEIVEKRLNPTWYPTPSIRADRPDLPHAVGPGPDNPLGSRGLYLGLDDYIIHGTNKPSGVGRQVSRGCIRMYEPDVRELYERVGIGTPVAIVYQPVKLGWSGGALYLEVHPSPDQALEIEATGSLSAAPIIGIENQILDAAGGGRAIDWDVVGRVVRERRGVPVRITVAD